MENKPKPSKKWVIIGGIVFVLVLIGIATSGSNVNNESASQKDIKQVAVTSNTQAPTEQINNKASTLNHDELLKVARENPNNVLNKKYEMTLYLEQKPSYTQAEFMSQPNDSSLDTILVTCNMKSNNIQKLDGESAQSRIYKPYDLFVTFTKYDNKVGLYYEAECDLK